jgi:hypothetical protein
VVVPLTVAVALAAIVSVVRVRMAIVVIVAVSTSCLSDQLTGGRQKPPMALVQVSAAQGRSTRSLNLTCP